MRSDQRDLDVSKPRFSNFLASAHTSGEQVCPSQHERRLVAVIKIGNFRQPETLAMFRSAHELMNSLIVDRAQSSFAPETLFGANVFLLIAHIEHAAVGCCAVILNGNYAELKKMYVSPVERGKGVGSQLLKYAEQLASNKGCGMLKLESATMLTNAHELYRRHGFSFGPPFGDHRDDPRSVFMEKRL